MDYVKEYANDIKKALDDNRVDEWHSEIPMSEEGLRIAEKLAEISYPNGNGGPNNLFLHQEEQGIVSITFESSEGRVAQVIRHDKNI
jgi:hypothetical protein